MGGSGDDLFTLEGYDKPYPFMDAEGSSDNDGAIETGNEGCGGDNDQGGGGGFTDLGGGGEGQQQGGAYCRGRRFQRD